MKYPNAPFLQFGFFFADQDDADSYACAVRSILDSNGEFDGSAEVYEAEDARNEPFKSPWELDTREVRCSKSALLELLDQREAKVIRTSFSKAISDNEIVPEILSYEGISKYAVGRDSHPLSIWSDGEAFSGPPEFSPVQQEQKIQVGRRAYTKFLDYVETMRPSYASITVESDLQCPSDLRRDADPYAFTDFYVSAEFVGKQKLAKFSLVLEGAYIHWFAGGYYYSTDAAFNPRGISFECDSLDVVLTEIARSIGRGRE